MRIRNKMFPYPIIAEGNDSYKNSSFISDADYDIKGHDIVFTLKAELINDELNTLLKQSKINFVHHIECGKTCYRTAISGIESEIIFTISEKHLKDKVEVCSFIIANMDITNYSNSDFENDYKGFKFDIDKGCILAVGNQIYFNISKDQDELKNTSSIFSVRRNFDENEKEIKISSSEEKIIISIPEKACNQYLNLNGTLSLQSALHSMVVIPALMSVLIELKDAGEDLFMYEDKRWYRALKKTSEKLNIDISQEGLANSDIYKTAQVLLDNPLIKALDDFSIGEGDEYED